MENLEKTFIPIKLPAENPFYERFIIEINWRIFLLKLHKGMLVRNFCTNFCQIELGH